MHTEDLTTLILIKLRELSVINRMTELREYSGRALIGSWFLGYFPNRYSAVVTACDNKLLIFKNV
jgi:hypothetical protein